MAGHDETREHGCSSGANPPYPVGGVPPTFCTACGAPIDSRAVICPRCGVAQHGVTSSGYERAAAQGSAATTIKSGTLWTRDWLRGRSKAARVALVIVPVIFLLLVVIVIRGHAPSDGQSCIGASDSDIQAWVDSKSSNIPSGVSQSLVAQQVSAICSTAQNANMPQSFDNDLLQLAVSGASSQASTDSTTTTDTTTTDTTATDTTTTDTTATDTTTTDTTATDTTATDTTTGAAASATNTCDPNISSAKGTSCPFAENVFKSYATALHAGNTNATVQATSPITGQSYTMDCKSDGSTVTCTGGNGALVTFPEHAAQVY